ncbi:MAG: hypothetical protein RIR00_463 [Pseudomonadota bacterium]|jgi:uncharacterized protein YbcC (UPF0753/DUF2309 family)
MSAPAATVRRLRDIVAHLEHVLPAQAPIENFVHHNTLHGFQYLPFADALQAVQQVTGETAWLPEARCRAWFAQGRIDRSDLEDALADIGADVGDSLGPWRQKDVLIAALLQAPEPLPLPALQRERAALAQQPGLAALWQVCCELFPLPAAEADGAAPWRDAAPQIWRGLVEQVGRRCSLGSLLQQLTGEDLAGRQRPLLIRHLAAHLDQGIAPWQNPARQQGFYAAWRASAFADPAWELEDLPNARNEIARLPEDPAECLERELNGQGIGEADWHDYLQRLALELPGWSGMFLWWHEHGAGHGGALPPVDMLDYLAVRVVLERLYAEDLAHRLWQVPLMLSEIEDHFLQHPEELWVRVLARHGACPDLLLHRLERLRRSAPEGSAPGRENWLTLAEALAGWRRENRNAADEHAAAVVWPLFTLLRQLGLQADDLRELGRAGAERLLDWAHGLSEAQRGLAWLLAYERHYREGIFAALTANHRRCPPRLGAPRAQLIFCMDDREEGSRRHLEEIAGDVETFGAAGFFGIPMAWQGLDDARPQNLCPVVVTPLHLVRETPQPGEERAAARHGDKRQRRLGLWESAFQAARRHPLGAVAFSGLGAVPATLALIGNSLFPAAWGGQLQRWREGLDGRVATQLVATAPDSAAAGTPEAPRPGFDNAEQAERVASFLRSIGLTTRFAPLVVFVGHGSASNNNPHRAAYDCGACSGRHGGPNARVFAHFANRPEIRALLAAQGILIPAETWFLGCSHNTCDDSIEWFDLAALPEARLPDFSRLRRELDAAMQAHAVERCRRLASAPVEPTPLQAFRHVAGRRNDMGQARPELGHATNAVALIGRRSLSRGAFFDRRAFLISYDPTQDASGSIVESILLAAGPVGAGIALEYYFSTVNNAYFGCGSKITHNLTGLVGVMDGTASDLRTGLPWQMVEIHEPMRLLVVVEQLPEVLTAIYQRQPALQELVGNGWIVLAAKDPYSPAIHRFIPGRGWQLWPGGPMLTPTLEQSADWFTGRHEALAPVLLRRPLQGMEAE